MQLTGQATTQEASAQHDCVTTYGMSACGFSGGRGAGGGFGVADNGDYQLGPDRRIRDDLGFERDGGHGSSVDKVEPLTRLSQMLSDGPGA